jgi:hypothetical protein
MLGTDGALLSLEGALLVDHRLSLGLAGYAFSRTPDGPTDVDGTPRRFGSGYGGFAVRYSFFTDLPVYGTAGLVVGGGAVALDDSIGRDSGPHDDGHRENVEGFFVVQPELSLQSNVTRWFRLGVTGGYRFASAVDRFGLSRSDMSGVVIGGNLQVGWL